MNNRRQIWGVFPFVCISFTLVLVGCQQTNDEEIVARRSPVAYRSLCAADELPLECFVRLDRNSQLSDSELILSIAHDAWADILKCENRDDVVVFFNYIGQADGELSELYRDLIAEMAAENPECLLSVVRTVHRSASERVMKMLVDWPDGEFAPPPDRYESIESFFLRVVAEVPELANCCTLANPCLYQEDGWQCTIDMPPKRIRCNSQSVVTAETCIRGCRYEPLAGAICKQKK